jgi:hypothetical protein
MPDVVSNTTPFQYLHQISCLDCLSHLYPQVKVPRAVADELRHGRLKGIDVPSIDALAWVAVETASPGHLQRVPSRLDAGEREAIALALGRPDPLRGGPGHSFYRDIGSARQSQKGRANVLRAGPYSSDRRLSASIFSLHSHSCRIQSKTIQASPQVQFRRSNSCADGFR